MEKSNKKYFAFISYKREDEEWAKWIQNELENYHLPAIPNGWPENTPKEYRPVFRDIDELKAGNLPKQIYKALEDSINLIVICSTKLADDEQAKWVNKEIEDFISIDENNVNRIFPFIVEGKPHSNDGKECFPRALRDLPKDNERIGGNVNEGDNVVEIGRERAFVKVLAGMMPNEVTFDMLWNRYDRDKQERERKEKEQRDNLLLLQSRFVAEKATTLLNGGDSYLAQCLCLEILPKCIENPNRPYCIEAEQLIRKAYGRRDAILHGNTSSVMASFFNNEDTTVLSIGYDAYLCKWDARSGMLIDKTHIDDGGGWTMDISPNGKLLAIIIGKKVILWHTSKQNIYLELLHSEIVLSVKFSHDGRYIVSGTNEGKITIWNIDGKCITEFIDNNNPMQKSIEWLNINVDNRIFASTRESLNIWDFDGEGVKYVGNIKIPNGWTNSMKFSSDGTFMINSSNEKVYIWDTQSFDPINQTYSLTQKSPLCHNDIIFALEISNDNNCIFVGASRFLYIWKYDTLMHEWRCASTIEYDAIIDHISSRNNLILISFNNSVVRILDRSSESPNIIPIAADSLDFNPNGASFSVISNRNSVPVIYDATNYNLVNQCACEAQIKELFKTIGDSTNSIRYHKSGKFIFTLSDFIIKWDAKKLSMLNNFEHSFGDYSCIFRIISNNGKRALYAFKDGRIYLINVKTNSIIVNIDLEERSQHIVATFSNDNKYIAIISEINVSIFDSANGKFLHRLPIPSFYWGNSIEFDSSDRFIVSATQNQRVELWEWDSEKLVSKHYLTLIAHTERVINASFNRDGSLIVSFSLNEIIIWDVKTGIPLKIIEHAIHLKFVKFSPKGNLIVGSDGRFLYTWNFPPVQELIDETLKRFENRQLTTEERKSFYLES